MRFKSLLLFLFIVVVLASCSKFDPYAPISDEQVVKLLQKAQKGVTLTEQPCDTISVEQMNAFMAKVQEMPLEPVTLREAAVIETNFGTIVLAFYPDKAPKHCEAFKRLVKSGFYDCTSFHRVVKDFVIQGGDLLTRDSDPSNDGMGNPGYNLPAEFNDIPHGAGILSMARARDINSAGSQFFICLSRQGTKNLDGKYTAFGKVVGGMNVIDKIADVPVNALEPGREPSFPVEPVFIKKAYMVTR